MVKQSWTVKSEECESRVKYNYSLLSGKCTLTVDNDTFTVKCKPLCIGVERREVIMLCGAQAILDVDKKGHAKLCVRDGEVKEIRYDMEEKL